MLMQNDRNYQFHYYREDNPSHATSPFPVVSDDALFGWLLIKHQLRVVGAGAGISLDWTLGKLPTIEPSSRSFKFAVYEIASINENEWDHLLWRRFCVVSMSALLHAWHSWMQWKAFRPTKDLGSLWYSNEVDAGDTGEFDVIFRKVPAAEGEFQWKSPDRNKY